MSGVTSVSTVESTAASTADTPNPPAGGVERSVERRTRHVEQDAIDIRPESFDHAGHRLVERFGPTAGEFLDVVGARPWHDAGFVGTGVRVAVIDFFDVTRFWDENEHGPAPVAGSTAVCFSNGESCVDEFFDGVDLGGDDHGVAVVETILDMAPGAEILIGQATTVADYQRLVDWFVARDVDVISRSLGSRYDGPGDGRGALNDVVASAVARGVLWVNSAGNNGRNKYYRHEVRLAGDRVAFGPSGSETYLRFTGCVALGGVRWANDWDTPAALRTDYDVYLLEAPTGDPSSGTIVARSEQRQRLGATPIETIGGSFCPGSGSSLYLEVRWRGGDVAGDVLEILDYGSGIAGFTSAPGSAAVSVVDSTLPGVLAVGAIDPAASSTIARYSSQGPSNDGRVLPDLVAPANFDNTVEGRFAGTSAAAAVIAGAAAVLSDAGLGAGPSGLGDLIRHLTVDLGPPGDDNAYGAGEFRLPAPPPPGGVDATPSRFVSLDVPTRFLDTRPATAIGPAESIGRVAAGSILELPVTGVGAVPVDHVTAVAVNLAITEPDRPSFVQALPTNRAPIDGYSNLNVDLPGQTRANFAIIPVGSDGRISLYTIADSHLIVDVLGWFEAAPTATDRGRFVELDTPERTLDTRVDAPARPIGSGGVLDVPMPTGVPLEQVEALVITLTAASPTGPGWLQAIPTGRRDVIGTTSTVNTAAGSTVANTAIVPVTGGGISIAAFFASGHAHVVVDVVGYISAAGAPSTTEGRYVPVRPGRVLDTRLGGGSLRDRGAAVADASTLAGSVPSDATAIVWNMAIVDAARPGFLRAWADGAPEPDTSALNWSTPGETRAGAVIAAAGDATTRFRVDDGDQDAPGRLGDLLADAFGYFT